MGAPMRQQSNRSVRQSVEAEAPIGSECQHGQSGAKGGGGGRGGTDGGWDMRQDGSKAGDIEARPARPTQWPW